MKTFIIFMVALVALGCEGNISLSDDSQSFENIPDTHGLRVPDKDEVPDEEIKNPVDDATSPTSLSRITRVEYANSIHAIFGENIVIDLDRLPLDERTEELFQANPGDFASAQDVEKYWAMSMVIADQLDLESLCDSEDVQQCSSELLDNFGVRVLKRPVSAETTLAFADYASTKFDEGSTKEQILTSLLSILLNMPEFLYHTAPVKDENSAQKVDGFVVAQRLSTFLFQENPDDILLAAAASGELDTKDGIEKHARRMLEDEKANRAIIAFHNQWLGVDGLPFVSLDSFADFDKLKPMMIKEFELFAINAVRQGSLSDLLGGSFSYINADLGEFYGVDGLGETFDRVDNIPNRKGILTQAAVLASSGSAEYTQPIFRGYFYLTNVLCGHIGPPVDLAQIAAEAEETEAGFTEDMSDRDKLTLLTSPANCAYCHQSIDPYGYASEMYDATGRYRELDYSGKRVDTTMVLKNQGDLDGEYGSSLELSQALAESQTFRKCYTQQWLRFALGHDVSTVEDAGIIYDGSQILKETDDIKELIVAISSSFAFRHRKPNQAD